MLLFGRRKYESVVRFGSFAVFRERNNFCLGPSVIGNEDVIDLGFAVIFEPCGKLSCRGLVVSLGFYEFKGVDNVHYSVA